MAIDEGIKLMAKEADAMERAIKLADLFEAIPASRILDLAARKEAGNLTALETLALAIIEGKPDAAQPLIDAAQEEYGSGQYRVPVRVLSSWRNALFVLNPPADATQSDVQLLQGSLSSFLKRNSTSKMASYRMLVLAPGSKLDIYEVEESEAGVKVEAKE